MQQLSLFPEFTQAPDVSGEVVYIAQRRSYIKIGTTKHPAQRMRRIEATPLVVMPGGRELEKQLHIRFNACRMAGEWFAPTPELWDYIWQLKWRQEEAA